MVPTAWIYSIQLEFLPPRLHRRLPLHSACHLSIKTYPLTPDTHDTQQAIYYSGGLWVYEAHYNSWIGRRYILCGIQWCHCWWPSVTANHCIFTFSLYVVRTYRLTTFMNSIPAYWLPTFLNITEDISIAGRKSCDKHAHVCVYSCYSQSSETPSCWLCQNWLCVCSLSFAVPCQQSVCVVC